MRGDFHDRLIDQLLREILGGDRPRDMTERVVAQAKIMDRFRRRIWWGAGSAMAAAAAIVVSMIVLWPRETAYPSPTIDSHVQITSGGDVLEPGTTLQTDMEEGQLDLGRYVQVKMAPETQLNLAGRPYQEKVLLSQGQLDVDVTKHKGQFDIAVGPALVHVTGTKFRVRVGQEETPTTWMRKLYLAVKEGSVEVQNVPSTAGAQTVSAGEERDFVLAMRPKVTNGGGVGFAQRTAQLGARGGPVSALLPGAGAGALRTGAAATAPHPTPPTNTALPPATLENRPVQMVTTPGSPTRVGRVQETGTIYYLQNGEGNFFMFERSTVAAAHPDWLSLPGTLYTRVTWSEGKVTGLERLAPQANTTTQPK